MSANTKKSTGNAKYVIPEDADPIKLADEMKKGITVKLLSDMEELRKRDFLKGRGIIRAIRAKA